MGSSTRASAMAEPTTSREIAGRWDRDGYLVVRDVIPHEVLEPVRAFIRGCVASASSP